MYCLFSIRIDDITNKSFNDDVNNEVDVPIEAVLVSWDVELYPGIENYTISLLG
jgi:hypothetical protein